MRFFRSLKKIPDSLHGGIVVIGNFDGVHQGHRRLLSTAADIARAEKRPLILLTFIPHPAAFFRPGNEGFLITPTRAKVRALSAFPPDAVVFMPFNEKLAHLSAEKFVSTVLIDGLRAARVVAGEDFSFGAKREGTAAFLSERFPDLPVTVVAKSRDENGEIVSSSRIRSFLRDGNVRKAAELLGRPFEIEGYVVHGFARGRTLGFPTANITTLTSIVPKRGVYAAKVLFDGKEYDAVANIGVRPTVAGRDIWLEAHLFDFDGDLYGKRLRVLFIDFIRPEKRFASLNELTQNIVTDCETAAEILK